MNSKEIDDLIYQLTSHSWSSKREEAAWNLGEFRTEAQKAVTYLIKALKDSSDDVQFYAAEALGKIRSEKALKPLQKLVFSSEFNMVLQNQCLLSIAMIRTDEAREVLMSIISDGDYDPILRRDATIALGRMRSKAKSEVYNLIKIFKVEEEDLVKIEIITTLGKSCTRAKKVTNFLIEIIQDTNLNWQFRNKAVESLGRLYTINAYREIIQVLVFDRSAYVRNTTVKTIRRLSLHFWDKYEEIVFELIRSILLAYELEETSFVLKQIESTKMTYEERLDEDILEKLEKSVKEFLDKEEYISEEDLENLLSFEFTFEELNGMSDDVFEELDDSIDFEDLGTERKILTTKFPIKVLLLGAAPNDQSNLYHERELSLIKKRVASKPKFRFDSQFGITKGEFISILQNKMVRILHISAHGSCGELILEDEETGQTDSISIEKIVTLIKIRNQNQLKDKISIIVFSSCDSDFDATEVANHVDCVIVMTDIIAIEDANNFAIGFYESICNGNNIETAFNFGLAMMDSNEQHIPKLLPEDEDFSQIYLFDKDD